jgi:hypothetical protein
MEVGGDILWYQDAQNVCSGVSIEFTVVVAWTDITNTWKLSAIGMDNCCYVGGQTGPVTGVENFALSCLSVRTEKLGSNWTYFQEILYLSTLRKSVEKIQASLKYDNNNRYFTWRPTYIYDGISLNSSKNEKFFRRSCRLNQNTHFIFNNVFGKSCGF